MRTDRLTFTGSAGSELAARLERPVGPPVAYALFAHCFTCSKDLHAVRRISAALSGLGVAVLRFDFTGLGESEGDFADTSFSSNVDDLVAAADFLRAEHEAPQLLIGHSLGGAAALAAAGRIPEAQAVATIGAPCEPSHVRRLIDASAAEIEERGEALVNLAGRTFRIKQQFLEDLDQQKMEQRIGALGRALLVMHSPVDQYVGIDNASCIFMAARHPKSFVALDGADHLLTRAKDAAFAADIIAAWARRHVTAPERESSASGEVIVRGSGGGLVQQVIAEHHHLIADEPTSVGGTELGPTPYGYLLAGLGACTSMTMGLYARRKKWALETVEVRLQHGRVHAQDCADCDKSVGQIDEIRRTISMEGQLDDEQRARLMEIADKCPVHRTLTNEIKIRTEPG